MVTERLDRDDRFVELCIEIMGGIRELISYLEANNYRIQSDAFKDTVRMRFESWCRKNHLVFEL
jgi:hypothetical protein